MNIIDIIKLVAAILVVAIHTQAFFDWDTSSLLFFSIDSLKSLAVPFFFICSGFFLGKKLIRSNAFESYRFELKRYFCRLFKPFALWGGIYMLLNFLNQVVVDNLEPVDVIRHQIFSLLVSSPGGGLWYIQAILCLIIILYFVRSKRVFNTLVISSFVLLFIPAFVEIKEVFSLNFIFKGFYFLFGILLASKSFKHAARHYWLMFVLFYFIVVLVGFLSDLNSVNRAIMRMLTVVSSCFLFFASLKTMCKLDPNQTIFIRKQSTIIYFTHFLCIYFYKVIFQIIGVSVSGHQTLFFVICAISLLFYSYILLKMSCFKSIVAKLY